MCVRKLIPKIYLETIYLFTLGADLNTAANTDQVKGVNNCRRNTVRDSWFQAEAAKASQDLWGPLKSEG